MDLKLLSYIRVIFMGIPSYFSYIVKNHREIIQKINDLKIPIHNLYIDSNSIVYDSLRALNGVEIDFDCPASASSTAGASRCLVRSLGCCS